MTKIVAEYIWLLGLVGWYIIRYPFERKARKVAVRRSLVDWYDRSLLVIAIIGLFLFPLVYVATDFPRALERPFVSEIAWAGVLALGAALFLFRRSHKDLGRFWSISLEVRQEHRLVTTGVYRRVRHPMYSSFLLLGLAQLLLLPNWAAGTSGLIGALMLFALRFPREERMMLDQFGDDYRRYMSATRRIIPWVV